MTVSIRPIDIPPDGRKRIEGDEPPTVLDLEPEADIRAAGPLHYDVEVQCAGHELVARGELRVRVDFTCVRCAQWFETEIREDEFLRAFSFSREDESVDLTPDMREAIILRFSSHPVCRPDCKGLCTRCGRDLNKGACDCPAPTDERWSGLDNLEL